MHVRGKLKQTSTVGIGNHGGRWKSSRFGRFLGGALLALSVSACVPGTFESIGTTLFIYEKDLDAQYKAEVRRMVDHYVQDLADTPCSENKVKPVEPLVDMIQDHRYTGVDKVLKRLNEIEHNEMYSKEVRAAAIYYQAVIYAMRKEPNKELAIGHLKELYRNYRDQYTCLFQESEWRDKMIEKYLLDAGEQLEEFKKKFREEALKEETP